MQFESVFEPPDPARLDNTAVVVHIRDAREVELVLGFFHERESFRKRLHHPVLDAVVDHLHEMAGSVARKKFISIAAREVSKKRLAFFERRLIAPYHQTPSFARAARAAGEADIDVANAALCEFSRTLYRIFEVRVAAVDNDITLRKLPRDAALPKKS